MTKDIIVAIDAMGGDHAPDIAIEGANLVLQRKKVPVSFRIYGAQSTVIPLLDRYEAVRQHSFFIHTDTVISGDDNISHAVRRNKDSSIYKAITAVKNKQASCVVSAGNTAALMAIAMTVLGTLPKIQRPAITTTLPKKNGEVVILDLGANVNCQAELLVQFAIMGDAFARVILDKTQPIVSLLNIGTEENKGKDEIKEAYKILKQRNIVNFPGYIEANNVMNSNVDVVVTDGFSGNIMLKGKEGIATTIKELLGELFASSMVNKFAYCLIRKKLTQILQYFDPCRRNGAMLIGVNGVVIKSHGRADALSFAYAIEVAIKVVQRDINTQISDLLND